MGLLRYIFGKRGRYAGVADRQDSRGAEAAEPAHEFPDLRYDNPDIESEYADLKGAVLTSLRMNKGKLRYANFIGNVLGELGKKNPELEERYRKHVERMREEGRRGNGIEYVSEADDRGFFKNYWIRIIPALDDAQGFVDPGEKAQYRAVLSAALENLDNSMGGGYHFRITQLHQDLEEQLPEIPAGRITHLVSKAIGRGDLVSRSHPIWTGRVPKVSIPGEEISVDEI